MRLRHACSPLSLFIRLRDGAEGDVKARNELRMPDEKFVFTIASQDGSFSVSRQGDPPDRVDFSYDDLGITVARLGGETVLEAAPVLTDEGESKLKLITGEILSCPEFRKFVLEDLFFNFPASASSLTVRR